MQNIKIKYLRNDLGELEQHGDWIDLYCAEDVILKQFEVKRIPLGVCMQLPEGYEAIVAPRSSTFSRYGIMQTNSIGVIDEKYCGDDDEWKMEVICMNPTDFLDGKRVSIIKAGTRICQFRLIPHQDYINFNIVERMGNANRGGYGSSGS